jgi:phosphatidylinositol glycan class C protein
MNPETCGKRARNSYPKLWDQDDDSTSNNTPSKKMPITITPDSEDSFHWARSVRNTELPSSGLQFAFIRNNDPFHTRLKEIVSRSLVVAHQFSLSNLFLVGHRCVVCRSVEDPNEKYCSPCFQDNMLLFSIHVFTATLVAIAISTMIARRCNQEANHQRKRDRLHSRSIDAILIAGILRFFSSVLRTLTASYSSDTVTALAIGGMAGSVASADYNYANGISRFSASKQRQELSSSYGERQRQKFMGGTVSINCVFFSAALLASRLPSDTVSYVFFMWTVILFAYFPEGRYLVSQTKFGVTGE